MLGFAPIAQLAEQWPFKPTVPGSIPGGRTKFYNPAVEPDLKLCEQSELPT